MSPASRMSAMPSRFPARPETRSTRYRAPGATRRNPPARPENGRGSTGTRDAFRIFHDNGIARR
jgi:hypothetical protein